MFKIRKEQIEMFSLKMEQQFELRMFEKFRGDESSLVTQMSDEALFQFIRKWSMDAKSHQIEYENEIEGYLELCCKYEAMIHEPRYTWILEILDYPNRPGEQKLRFLSHELASHQ